MLIVSLVLIAATAETALFICAVKQLRLNEKLTRKLAKKRKKK